MAGGTLTFSNSTIDEDIEAVGVARRWSSGTPSLHGAATISVAASPPSPTTTTSTPVTPATCRERTCAGSIRCSARWRTTAVPPRLACRSRAARRATPAIPVWPGVAASPARRPTSAASRGRWDQRCDIGAFEGLQTGSTSTTTSTTTTTTTTSTTTTILCGPGPQTGCQPALGAEVEAHAEEPAGRYEEPALLELDQQRRGAARSVLRGSRGGRRSTMWCVSTTREA